MATVGNVKIVISEKTVSPSFGVAGKHVKRHARRAQKRQADFDWLNPHSLGTISTFDSIANLA